MCKLLKAGDTPGVKGGSRVHFSKKLELPGQNKFVPTESGFVSDLAQLPRPGFFLGLHEGSALDSRPLKHSASMSLGALHPYKDRSRDSLDAMRNTTGTNTPTEKTSWLTWRKAVVKKDLCFLFAFC